MGFRLNFLVVWRVQIYRTIKILLTVWGGLLSQTHSSPVQIVVLCLFNVIMVKQKGGLLIALWNNEICCNHIMFQLAEQNSIMIWHIDRFNKIKYSSIIVERFDVGILERYAQYLT